MRIQIIQIGKTREKYLQELEAEYLKRLQAFAKIEITTIKDNSSGKLEQLTPEILKKIKKNTYLIVLDETGQQLSSPNFAKKLQQIQTQTGHCTFVIGGDLGLNQEIKNKADLLLSISKMTFTHQMIRGFLLEQIYRGYCISSGKKYHK